MGITIAYRGRLADLARVEDFEDRLLDFALEYGGLAQIWRSYSDGDPQRMVRGVLLHLAPGQEPVSLLLSPEGWLLGLVDIEDAECGRLTEPPWCFTKTQFGPIEGHVAIVEMFVVLHREFLADLEVKDEGGYWDTHDLAELARRRGLIQEGIDRISAGLARHGLSHEAAEDPAILLQRIERVAALVHRTLRRPSEHPPVLFPDDEPEEALDAEAVEALWDEMFKHNRRQQERLQRALEERQSRGEEDEAFDNALHDLGLEVPDEDAEDSDEPWQDEEGPFDEPIADLAEDDAGVWDDDAEEDDFANEDDGPFAKRHPLLERAMNFLHRLHQLFGNGGKEGAPALQTLVQGAGDTMGGLAQALSRHGDEDVLETYGLRVVQLKRALRGAAFARGALFPLRASLSAEAFDEVHQTLQQMEGDVFQELSRLRTQRGA